MSLALFPHLKVLTDTDGNVLITQDAAGTPQPAKVLAETKGASNASGYLSTADQAGGAAAGSAPALNQKVRINAANALCVETVAAGGTPGPLTNFGNIKLRLDVNGFVLIAVRAAGTPATVPRALANQKVRLDENGSLLCAVGP